MKVKHKALIIILLSVTVLVSTTSLIFYLTYFGYINMNEQDEMRQVFKNIEFIIENEESSLESTLIDWAHWDDTYNFIEDLNTEYADSNLQDNTLRTLNLKGMYFLNSSGEIVFSKEYEIEDEVSMQLKKKVTNDKSLVKKYSPLISGSQSNIGELVIGGNTFMLAAAQVIPSDEEGESNGGLIFVRSIEGNIVNYINNIVNSKVTFSQFNPQVNKYLVTEDSYIKTEAVNKRVEGYKKIKDIDGNFTIIFSMTKPLEDYYHIFHYFRIFAIYFLVSMIAIITSTLVFTNKFILKRLHKFHSFIDIVAKTKDTTLSIDMGGRDEFTELAEITNNMLFQLDSAYNEIKQSDERFRLILETTNDGYVDYNIKENLVYISENWKIVMGILATEGIIAYKSYISKIHPECYLRLKESFKNFSNGDLDYLDEEYRVIGNENDIIWVHQRGKVIEKDAEGKAIRLVCTLANISERKKSEEEILFLSYSDKLTGLKNRAYMEKRFERLDSNKEASYFIIMGDVNGLKLANDSLGHKSGDKLLIIASSILKKCCAKDDIVARWGGDEFVVLVKNKPESYVDRLVDVIKEECLQINDFQFTVSMAIGAAGKNSEFKDTDSVMSLAEKRMYRNKLMEDKSSRNATISTLIKTLHEKHSETEEHTLRIKNLVLKLGQRLGLPQDKLDELELLATLHDIGKIGIPEQILMKPGKLTYEEWEIMKTHSEIGYRIVKSTPELSHIAEGILYHHERYDGTGYPKGIKGEEIPILSRIINVADSFDVMTHKRIYKDSFSEDYAFEEIKRCSGTQFDPNITDIFMNMLKADR